MSALQFCRPLLSLLTWYTMTWVGHHSNGLKLDPIHDSYPKTVTSPGNWITNSTNTSQVHFGTDEEMLTRWTELQTSNTDPAEIIPHPSELRGHGNVMARLTTLPYNLAEREESSMSEIVPTSSLFEGYETVRKEPQGEAAAHKTEVQNGTDATAQTDKNVSNGLVPLAEALSEIEATEQIHRKRLSASEPLTADGGEMQSDREEKAQIQASTEREPTGKSETEPSGEEETVTEHTWDGLSDLKSHTEGQIETVLEGKGETIPEGRGESETIPEDESESGTLPEGGGESETVPEEAGQGEIVPVIESQSGTIGDSPGKTATNLEGKSDSEPREDGQRETEPVGKSQSEVNDGQDEAISTVGTKSDSMRNEQKEIEPEVETQSKTDPEIEASSSGIEVEPEAEAEVEPDSEGELDFAGEELVANPEYEIHVLVTLVVSYIVVSLLIVLGNVILIRSICTRASMRTKIANMYLLSLLISRTCIGLFVIPGRITGMFSEQYLGQAFCKLCHFVASGSLVTSVFSIVAMAIIRLHEVKQAKQSTPCTLNRHYIVIALIWLTSFGYAIRAPIVTSLILISTKTSSIWLCIADPAYAMYDKYFVVLDLTVLLLIPLTIIIPAYFLVIAQLTHNHLTITQQETGDDRQTASRNLASIKMTVILNLLFITCCSPPLALTSYLTWTEFYFEGIEVVEAVLQIASYSNAWINILIFIHFRHDLREAILEDVGDWFGKKGCWCRSKVGSV